LPAEDLLVEFVSTFDVVQRDFEVHDLRAHGCLGGPSGALLKRVVRRC
jgi:hypothetical protein